MSETGMSIDYDLSEGRQLCSEDEVPLRANALG
jgi:hypothetical protein